MSFILLGILNSQAAAGGAGAYDLLETTVLTSSASSVSFTGLGSYTDYKHLQLRAVQRNNVGTFVTSRLQFNGNTSYIYSSHWLEAENGSVVSQYPSIDQDYIAISRKSAGSSQPANTFSAHIIDILDFANTSKTTTIRSLGGVPGTGSSIALNSGLWNNTDAVTSISLIGQNSFVTGSRFSLYGIKGE